MEKVVSGIRPTGNLHLGNYFGAVKSFVEMQDKYNCMFFTSFYNNPNATETYAFNQRFRSTFGRDQYNTYPRYGMLGYDIANFFVQYIKPKFLAF